MSRDVDVRLRSKALREPQLPFRRGPPKFMPGNQSGMLFHQPSEEGDDHRRPLKSREYSCGKTPHLGLLGNSQPGLSGANSGRVQDYNREPDREKLAVQRQRLRELLRTTEGRLIQKQQSNLRLPVRQLSQLSQQLRQRQKERELARAHQAKQKSWQPSTLQPQQHVESWNGSETLYKPQPVHPTRPTKPSQSPRSRPLPAATATQTEGRATVFEADKNAQARIKKAPSLGNLLRPKPLRVQRPIVEHDQGGVWLFPNFSPPRILAPQPLQLERIEADSSVPRNEPSAKRARLDCQAGSSESPELASQKAATAASGMVDHAATEEGGPSAITSSGSEAAHLQQPPEPVPQSEAPQNTPEGRNLLQADESNSGGLVEMGPAERLAPKEKHRQSSELDLRSQHSQLQSPRNSPRGRESKSPEAKTASDRSIEGCTGEVTAERKEQHQAVGHKPKHAQASQFLETSRNCRFDGLAAAKRRRSLPAKFQDYAHGLALDSSLESEAGSLTRDFDRTQSGNPRIFGASNCRTEQGRPFSRKRSKQAAAKRQRLAMASETPEGGEATAPRSEPGDQAALCPLSLQLANGKGGNERHCPDVEEAPRPSPQACSPQSRPPMSSASEDLGQLSQLLHEAAELALESQREAEMSPRSEEKASQDRNPEKAGQAKRPLFPQSSAEGEENAATGLPTTLQRREAALPPPTACRKEMYSPMIHAQPVLLQIQANSSEAGTSLPWPESREYEASAATRMDTDTLPSWLLDYAPQPAEFSQEHSPEPEIWASPNRRLESDHTAEELQPRAPPVILPDDLQSPQTRQSKRLRQKRLEAGNELAASNARLGQADMEVSRHPEQRRQSARIAQRIDSGCKATVQERACEDGTSLAEQQRTCVAEKEAIIGFDCVPHESGPEMGLIPAVSLLSPQQHTQLCQVGDSEIQYESPRGDAMTHFLDSSNDHITAQALAERLEAAEGVPLGVIPCSEDHHNLLKLWPIALRRAKRIPGGNPLDHPPFQRFMDMIRGNSREFEAEGRILRLKQYMVSDANCAMMEAVISALESNTRVQGLYIQNFEAGMYDRQLQLLTDVLKRKHIWALNIGENFNISLDAWQTFTNALPQTAVSYLYVSEHHLLRTNLKAQMRKAIRENRRKLPPQDPEVTARITNMWWNPPKHKKQPQGSRCQPI